MSGRPQKQVRIILFVCSLVAVCAVYGLFQCSQVFLNEYAFDFASKKFVNVSKPTPKTNNNSTINSAESKNDAIQTKALLGNSIISNEELNSGSNVCSQQTEQGLENDLFCSYNEQAKVKLSKMTVEEKVGQLFIFQCPSSDAIQMVEQYKPSGYCLLASHFRDKTAKQAKQMIQSYQKASDIPMIIAVDEEGGTVVRVSGFSNLASNRFRSPQQVFQSGGINAIYDDTVRKSQLLLSLGINLNLAPVADVSTNTSNFIYDRSFGKSAEETAKFVETFIKAANNQNISSTLKHFPGYGNNEDTHTGIAYDTRSMDVFENSDFIPFSAGIQAGAQCVMISHNIVNCMDPKKPASLSPKVHEILRKQLKFSGIIMTDDLSMGAIKEFTNKKNPCSEAFLAGNDILLTSSIKEDYESVLESVKRGKISIKRVDESVLRILAWKYSTGMLK